MNLPNPCNMKDSHSPTSTHMFSSNFPQQRLKNALSRRTPTLAVSAKFSRSTSGAIGSMIHGTNGIFTYIYHKKSTKSRCIYTIHGSYGLWFGGLFSTMIMVNHSLMTLMMSGISCVCSYEKRWRRGKISLEMWWICWRTDITLVRHVNVMSYLLVYCWYMQAVLPFRIHHPLLIGFVFVKNPSDSFRFQWFQSPSACFTSSLLWWVYVDMSHTNRRLQAAQAAGPSPDRNSDHPSLEFAFFDCIGKAWQILEANWHPGCPGIGQKDQLPWWEASRQA